MNLLNFLQLGVKYALVIVWWVMGWLAISSLVLLIGFAIYAAYIDIDLFNIVDYLVFIIMSWFWLCVRDDYRFSKLKTQLKLLKYRHRQ